MLRGLQKLIQNRRFAKVALDAVAIAASFAIAIAIRFEFAIPSSYFTRYFPIIPAVVALYLLVNYAFKIYSGHWKFASFDELLGLTSSTACATLVLFVFVLAVPGARKFIPISVPVIGGVLSLFTMAFARLQFRLIRDRRLRSRADGGTKVLVVGAGEAGEMVARDMLRHPQYDYNPLGFIDDDPGKKNLTVHGIPVLGTREEIPAAVKDHDIDEIIIAMPSVEGERIKDVLHFCDKTDAKIKIIPSMLISMADEAGVAAARELKLEDLLGRPPCRIDLESVSAYVTDNVVLVTGAGGSIGSEIACQLCHLGPKHLVLLDRDSTSLHDLEMKARGMPHDCDVDMVIADVRDRDRMQSVMRRFRPRIVFHSAALKHVPMLEYHPSEAVKNNVMGTRNLVESSAENGVERFILISTDKAVNPVNVMGASKRLSEFIVGCSSGRNGMTCSAVRFGNVIGSRGSVVPIFQKQIEAGGPVTVTHPEATRYFMTIEEAAQLVIQAGAFAEDGDIFLLDMGKPVRIMDLAREMIKLTGNGENIDIRITGLRPGEKLHEQLLFSTEELLETPHPKIHRVATATELPDGFHARVETLIELSVEDDDDGIKRLMRDMIPCYGRGAVTGDEVERGEDGPDLRIVN